MRWFVFFVLLLACSPSKNTSETRDEGAVVERANPSPTTEPEAAKSAEGQSFKLGMQLICDSINEVDRDLDPAARQRAVAAWIDKNVTNPQVRELFSIMGDVAPNKRAGMMRAAAAKAGVETCAIAEQ